MLTSVIERLNEKRSAKFEGEADSGFTLIELMVVLLIMAILLAIAIPTFLGVKGGAQDRSAQSDLNTALTNAKAYYGNNQSYGSTSSATAVTALSSGEASLTFTAANNALAQTNTLPNPGVAQKVFVATSSDGNGILLINRSQNGDCWAILTNEAAEPIGTSFSGATLAAGTVWPINQAGTYYLSVTASTGTPTTTATCTIPTTATTTAASTQPASSGVSGGSWQQNAFTGAQ